MSSQAPGVHALDHGHSGRAQPVFQTASGAPVRRMPGKLPDNHSAHLREGRLHVVFVHAVIANHRRRHDDDLSQVARVGKRLLVSSQVRGEHHFTKRRRQWPRAAAGKPGAVLQQNESGAIGHPITPLSPISVLTSSVAEEPRCPAPVWRGRPKEEALVRSKEPRCYPLPVWMSKARVLLDQAEPTAAEPVPEPRDWPPGASPATRSSSRRAEPATTRVRVPGKCRRTTSSAW